MGNKGLHKWITIRMGDETVERVDEICKDTGMTRSQVIRHLVDNASVRPAIIRTEVDVRQEGVRNGGQDGVG